MTEKLVTGERGCVLIRGRVLDAVYAMHGEYRDAHGRIEKTYEALAQGPRDGNYLFQHGNWMPKKKQPMPLKDFKDHLTWTVREGRLHVLLPRDWARYKAILPSNVALLPSIEGEEEFEGYSEGKVGTALVNRYERDPRNCKAAIAKHGTRCFGCRHEMRELYGDIATGFIHIHHVRPLSRTGGPTKPEIDDLIPLCPNCHAVVHLQSPPLGIHQLQKLVVNPQVKNVR